jgi:hypothetical protein
VLALLVFLLSSRWRPRTPAARACDTRHAGIPYWATSRRVVRSRACGSPRDQCVSGHRCERTGQSARTVPHLPQDRLGPLREWVRAPGLLAARLRRTTRLVDRPATPGHDRGRAGDAGTGLHDGDLHRVSGGGPTGSIARHARDLSASFRLRRSGPASGTAVGPLFSARIAPRRSEHGGSRAHGRCAVGTRTHGDRRSAERVPGARSARRAPPLRGEFGLAHRRSVGRSRSRPVSSDGAPSGHHPSPVPPPAEQTPASTPHPPVTHDRKPITAKG